MLQLSLQVTSYGNKKRSLLAFLPPPPTPESADGTAACPPDDELEGRPPADDPAPDTVEAWCVSDKRKTKEAHNYVQTTLTHQQQQPINSNNNNIAMAMPEHNLLLEQSTPASAWYHELMPALNSPLAHTTQATSCAALEGTPSRTSGGSPNWSISHLHQVSQSKNQGEGP